MCFVRGNVALCKKTRIGDKIHFRIHYQSVSTTNRKKNINRKSKRNKNEKKIKKKLLGNGCVYKAHKYSFRTRISFFLCEFVRFGETNLHLIVVVVVVCPSIHHSTFMSIDYYLNSLFSLAMLALCPTLPISISK